MYKQRENYNSPIHKEFICDAEGDVLELPNDCAPGSIALVVDTGNLYMFNNQEQWVLFIRAEGE